MVTVSAMLGALLLAGGLPQLLPAWLRGRQRRRQIVRADEVLRARSTVNEFRQALRDCGTVENGARLNSRAAEIMANIQTIHCLRNTTPKISACDPADSHSVQELAAKVWREEVTPGRASTLQAAIQRLPVDTPHALVFEEDIVSRDRYCFFPTQYAELCAILKTVDLELSKGLCVLADVSIPLVLGAGGLVVCPDTNELILLERAPSKTMHPGKLHVFGGNFEPSLGRAGQRYDRTLEENAAREIGEESSYETADVDGTLVVAHMERADPDIQEDRDHDSDGWKRLMRNLPVHYCGICVDRNTRDRMLGFSSPEGRPRAVPAALLADRLQDIDLWVPAGWYTTMLWLWMGAPTQAQPLISPAAARRIAMTVLGLRQSHPLTRLLERLGLAKRS